MPLPPATTELDTLPAAAASQSEPNGLIGNTALRVSIVGIFVILVVAALFLAKEVLLPIALAIMITLTLSPVVRLLARYRVPEWASSLAIMVALVGGVAAGAYYLSGPVSGWIDGAPQTGRQLREKLDSMRKPMDAAVNASKQVEEITAGSEDPTVQKVVVQQPGLVQRAAGSAVSVVTTAGVTIVLMFFLLATGRLFYEKLVRVLPTMTEKKRAIRVLHTVEEEVSHYLLTITLINAGLGAVISAVMWALGMPNPLLWGVMAALLNYVPYVGALVGLVVVAIVALVSFDSAGAAMVVPALYFACTTIEGQIVTPMLLGKRFEMNPVMVFLTVVVWGWLWGAPGALMAVPLLVSLRVLCDHFEGLASLGEFLGGPRTEPREPEEPTTEGGLAPPGPGSA
jgi:predicted PurR-regulated permease PerM